MTDEQREAIDDKICDILTKHGPDGHIDGHEELTAYACELIAAERKRCAKVAENVAADIAADELINVEIAAEIVAAIRAEPQ